MSKQTTLFSKWGGHSTTNGDRPSTGHQQQGQASPVDLDKTIDYDQFLEDDLQLTEKDLEALCDLNDDMSPSPEPHSQLPQANSFHVGPSHSFLNSSIIEEEIPGFDNEAGQLWIYPTNYPLRDYQFNIVHKALFTNTLVCLPTGLGKTFIAAVVMYNFYRWYPNGKIVFQAPTKPLVTQQIEACHNVMGIPQEHSAEMTGQMSPKMRASMWQSKRVFFLTPQVMQNDLLKATCPAQDVCCVVFDEAHKALGNHAYCQVVKELSKSKVRFRVLALSATPGNDLKAVQQVVTNLQVGHIELRSEDSIDIQRYSHERKVEKIIVPLDGDIVDVKLSFARILSGVLNRLIRYGVLYHCTPDRLSKYQLLQAREQFRVNGAPSGVMPGTVEGDFASAISLFHAYELLQLHGMKSFYQFLTTTFTAGGQQSKAKAEILRSPQFGNILKGLKERVRLSESSQLAADRQALQFPRMGGGQSTKSDNNPIEEKPSFFYSHPKLRKLEDIVLEHFRHFHDDQSDGPLNTRVMIFSQYRDSVQEITDMLNRHAPLVRVMSFVGHSSGKSNSKGLTQREQTEIVRKFREGGYNTLVATCVGEEGLDIGDVDLIVCFDAPKSPIRLVQRMGRTGRKRKGRIVMIVAEGKEDHVYNKSQSNKKSIHRAISNGCKTLTYYQQCHRMVPKHINPRVHKMHMSVSEFVGPKQTKKEISLNHLKLSSNQAKIKFGNGGKKMKKGTYLNDQELNCWSEGLSLTDREFKAVEKSVERCFSQQLLCMSSLNAITDRVQSNTSTLGRSVCSVNTSLNSSVGKMNAAFSLGLDRWVNHQVSSIPQKIVGHSSKSEDLMSTLEFIDLLRTSEGMGQSYDLEMETFLDRNDVKLTERHDRLVPSGGEVGIKNLVTPSIEGPTDAKVNRVQKKINIAKVKQFIDDSSGDEDFLPSKKVSAQTKNISYSTKSMRTSLSPTIHVHNGQMSTPPIGESDLMLTHSQHVIPRAPSEDGLDWLDELEPSQVSTPYIAHTKSSASMDLDLSPVIPDSRDKRNRNIRYDSHSDFATPNLPLSSVRRSTCKLRPPKYSTPAVEHDSYRNSGPVINETPVKNDVGSIDLFEDLSAHALFDDFSTSGIECVGDSKTSASVLSIAHTNHMETATDLPSSTSIDKLTEHCDKHTEVIVLSDTDADNEMDVDVIKESDLEQDDNDSCTEEDGSSTLDNALRPATNPSESSIKSKRNSTTSNDDSFLLVRRKCRKRPRILQSPTSPNDSKVHSKLSPGSKENVSYSHAIQDVHVSPSTKCVLGRKKKLKVTFEWDSSDDEFALPPSKRIAQSKSGKSHAKPLLRERSGNNRTGSKKKNFPKNEFFEEEAEWSSDDAPRESGTDQSDLGDLNNYDCEDSFINDNSMLTQLSPTRRVATSSKISNAQSNSNNFYLQSLMSPEDRLFAGKRRGCGSKYRMVFSQRHELLNHYINKAGFKVADGGRTKHKRKTTDEKRHFDDDNGLFETDSSNSEAEEVNVHYGEEELSQSLGHETFSCPSVSSVSESCGQETPEEEGSVIKLCTKRKRKAAFLSDSDMDTSTGVTESKTSMKSFIEQKTKSYFPKTETDVINNFRRPTSTLGRTSSDEVIISPSLLASIKITRTPPCFSLGMDDWIEDVAFQSE